MKKNLTNNSNNSVVEESALESQYARAQRNGHTYSAAKEAIRLPKFTKDELKSEIWREVPDSVTGGAPREASNLGRVRNSLTKKLLVPQVNFCGAVLVAGKRNKDGHIRMTQASRLVFFAFNPDLADVEFSERMDVDHIDGNKANNRIENIRLITHARNIRRAWTPVRIGDMVYPGLSTVGRLYGTDPSAVKWWIYRGYTPDGKYIEFSPEYQDVSDGLMVRL